MACDCKPENTNPEGMRLSPNRVGKKKEYGGTYEVTGEFAISIKGARDREAALGVILSMLQPSAMATAYAIASMPEAKHFSEDGGVYTLSGYICCDYTNNTYSWCPCGICCCNFAGTGCPA